MHLRLATLEDVALLRHWDQQPHVRRARGADADADAADEDWDWAVEVPRSLPWRELLIAEEKDRPVAFLQIIDPAVEESHYWGECEPNLRALDIWIGEASDLARGYGTRIMRLAIDRCFVPPEVRAVVIDPLVSNADARRFYERLGFVHLEDRHFDEDHCAVYRLDRAAWINVETK